MSARHNAPVVGPIYNNIAPMYPHIPPNKQPAAGTIMSQFKDNYYPIVHPVFGLIGYSNAPVHPLTFQRMDNGNGNMNNNNVNGGNNGNNNNVNNRVGKK